ncbi:MAG: sulfite oxidase-like oxidoreductase [Chloroflexi bacterium]|nr:sulfite oxidase-like oxidoreductase [Chloroflexota bacterium]MCH8108894.1 sulfite oxidase-like oxidoreductase [Chloroflexota bacterium]
MLRKLGRTQTIKQDQKGVEVPPGQFLTEKFPVLTFGSAPKIDLETWQFKVSGLVEKELTLTWEEFMGLEKITLDAEFHCVTQWSRLQNTWEGIAFNEVMKLLKLKPEAKYVMAHCYGGYSTNLALDVVTDDDVLFAYKHDGELLSRDHGGPLRLVVPKRYGWKSAKWVNGLEFMAEDEPGFWEVRGYHMRGDPWKEERFRSDLY